MSVDLDQTPRSILVWERSSFLDEKNRINSEVEQLHFNYKVTPLACLRRLVFGLALRSTLQWLCQ